MSPLAFAYVVIFFEGIKLLVLLLYRQTCGLATSSNQHISNGHEVELVRAHSYDLYMGDRGGDATSLIYWSTFDSSIVGSSLVTSKSY
jgi:hypothetical protein